MLAAHGNYRGRQVTRRACRSEAQLGLPSILESKFAALSISEPATVLTFLLTERLSAQTIAVPSATMPADDDSILLSPFTVNAESDTGYLAKSTLAGTRVRTELKDVASSITVVTSQFLKDTGVRRKKGRLLLLKIRFSLVTPGSFHPDFYWIVG
jgi:hypothetical protein